MIRAHRVNATAQDDASLVSGWNIAPNVTYILRLLPGPASCGILLYGEDNALVATGAALVGTEQPCVLLPQTGQTVSMVDSDLGWHLLLTTVGAESQREIRISPAVDLPDEIHPVYADDDLALARATAAVDAATHYPEDITVTCPNGAGAGLRNVIAVPVDGVSAIGQSESTTWTGTPDGASEQVVIRRHVAIAPEPFVEPVPIVPPVIADDAGTTDAATTTSGNVLTNDATGLTVVAVNGLSASVGVAVDGSNGGTFTIASNGAWTFDPDGDFAALEGLETADTSVTYYASDGVSEAMATLTVTVSSGAALWTPAEITTALWLDAADADTITLNDSTVSQWSDKSGAAKHAGQSNALYQPIYDADGWDGSLPTLIFDGLADVMSTTLTMPVQHFVFFVAERGTQGNNTTTVLRPVVESCGYGSSSPGLFSYGTQRGTLTNVDIAAGSTRVPTVSGNWAVAEKLIIGAHYDGASLVGYKNGDSYGSASVSLTAEYAVAIGGSLNTYFPVRRFAGKISEIVIISGAVDSATRQKIEGYLAHKWGLAAGLPSGHPYKSTPPTL